jgi:hypothetical protein
MGRQNAEGCQQIAKYQKTDTQWQDIGVNEARKQVRSWPEMGQNVSLRRLWSKCNKTHRTSLRIKAEHEF